MRTLSGKSGPVAENSISGNSRNPRKAALESAFTRVHPWLRIFVLSLFVCVSASAASLQVKIVPKFSGEAIQPASLRYQTAAGETLSITRVSFLASDFALQRMDGSWFEIANSIGWFDLERDRNSVRFDNVPSGEFRSIRFLIGLNANLNHADVAQFPADHPLNPNLNGLHWSWQGGYIFAALEGLWRNNAGELDGWAYHLARDTNSAQIILPLALNTSDEAVIELDFDLSMLLNTPRPISFAKDGSSTHSRDGDPIAATLKANFAGVFRVQRIASRNDPDITANTVKPLYLPLKFTPYRFRMSATFPIPDLPKDNPLIEERVALGKVLFNEAALSKDNSLSCASCHKQNAAFSDPRRFSAGVRDQLGTRNAMPLFNLAWKRSFFWDGRAPTLRAQSLMPIQDHREMDESLTNVVAKLSAIRGEAALIKGAGADLSLMSVPANTMDYAALFAAAFGSPEITPEKISLALEQFLLTLTSFDSRFDRAARGEEKLTAQEQRGLELFMTEYDPRRGQYGADCFHCHGGPLFQSQSFANNGLDSEFPDPGRAKVTDKASDQGKFATPSLRNVALTGPYMHDGRFQTLEEVVKHYSSGVKRSAALDPNLAKHPDTGILLSGEDQAALVAFLRTLTDEKFQRGIQ